MDGVNSVTLIGNVGNISEVYETNKNNKIVTLSLATTERYYDSDNNKKNETQWHHVVFWNSLADICSKMIQKGSTIYVEGKLNYKKKSDNSVITEIIAKSVRVLFKNKVRSIEDLEEEGFE